MRVDMYAFGKIASGYMDIWDIVGVHVGICAISVSVSDYRGSGEGVCVLMCMRLAKLRVTIWDIVALKMSTC